MLGSGDKLFVYKFCGLMDYGGAQMESWVGGYAEVFIIFYQWTPLGKNQHFK